MKLRLQIFLVTLIPIVALLIVSIVGTILARGQLGKSTRVERDLDYIARSAKLVHQLQTERTLTIDALSPDSAR